MLSLQCVRMLSSVDHSGLAAAPCGSTNCRFHEYNGMQNAACSDLDGTLTPLHNGSSHTYRQLLSVDHRGGALDVLQHHTVAALRDQVPTARAAFIETHFKVAVKTLCAIGANLGLSRECRYYFYEQMHVLK